ncbi:hypothetical protein AVEN_260281-1 [Araneus ventricosus]|uniref:Uncharacterized protein n=1 Tax=Araneus ventricosus TaxID=182803 RepID=A0A4Y2QIL4_ARAVE|nr:hypothetical protein AVEN_260281-1 [Araneus ventricosus]
MERLRLRFEWCSEAEGALKSDFRHLFQNLDGKSTGPKSLRKPIGEKLSGCGKCPVTGSKSIDYQMPIIDRSILKVHFKLRNGEKCLLICVQRQERQNFVQQRSANIRGRGRLVVRSRMWGRRVPGSKPDSTADPSCNGPVAHQIIRRGQKSSVGVVRKIGEGAPSLALPW